MAGCNRRVRLRNPLREICTVGSVREETSRWCHGEPKRARSWKRRTQPRKTYSLSGLLYSERGDLSTVGTSEIRGTTMKPDGGDCGRQRLRSRRASAFPERTSVVANALRGAASMHLPLRPIHLACCLSDYLVQSVQTLKCGSAGSCLLSRLYVLSKGLSLTNVMAEHLS
jgi:hypothetical protein